MADTMNVLVTGASGGLGGAVVEQFARAGARVATVDRHHHAPHPDVSPFPTVLPRPSGAMKVADKIVSLVADLLDEEAVAKVVKEADDKLGGIDAVLHLVGAWAGGKLSDTKSDEWRRLMGINLGSAFLVARESVRAMTPRGHGRIVFVGAQAALAPAPGMAAYATAKAGLLAMARTLAEEVRPSGITVNVVLPSTIDTPANRAAMPKADTAKWVQPTEIASLMQFLCGEAAAKITGAAIPIGT